MPHTRIFMAILAFVGIVFLNSSCSPTSKAKRLLRQAYAKIEKAKTLDHTLIDTINGRKNIVIDVPGDSGSLAIAPKIDSGAFEVTLKRYDSLNAWVAKLNADHDADLIYLQGYVMTTELKNAALHKANEQMKMIKNRLMRGFSKDSTYTLKDTLVSVFASVKNGQIDSIWYDFKPRKISTIIDTKDISLDATASPWRQTWFWILSVLILLLILVIIVGRKRNNGV